MSDSVPPNQSQAPSSGAGASSSIDDLARIFNSALISSREQEMSNFSAELYGLMQSHAFKAILASVRKLAEDSGVSDKEAAEVVITTFRKIDGIWSEYIFQEGVDRLKSTQ